MQIPNHVGIIMDGNRRWAKAQGLASVKGHFKGYHTFHEIGLYLLKEKKIPFVSAFVFSTENWSRAEDEVGYLMKLVIRALKEFLDEFHKEGVRILVLGRRDRLSSEVLSAIEQAETTTKDNQNGTLALCFNYGGQQEIVDAAEAMAKAGDIKYDIESFAKYLYHPEVPPLDLVIRTSGEQRISGYMLWRAAYAEFLFIDKHWPDFTKADADAALVEFSNRQRRYGK